MASFTSHFKQGRWPVRTLLLFLTASLIWIACVAYSIWINPENRFWTQAARVKQRWARRMTREHGAKYVIFGSSSCTFSIDGERMLEQHGMPAVNMGLYAGCGSKIFAEWALSEVKPGDTLVVALEPAMLSGDAVEPTANGIQFCYAMYSPQWIHGVLEPAAPLGPGSLLALRPSGYHLCVLLGRIALRHPAYRYFTSRLHPSGWIETDIENVDHGTPGQGTGISLPAQILLRSLNDWCQTNHVRVCHSLPVAYCPPELLESFQRENARRLLEISRFIPVLEDRRLGANTNRALYADSAWHFKASGVALRTDELAAQLRAWRMWNPEELRAIAATKTPDARRP